VLVDDLITRGADEPYRMFTSRAEYRLLLREDNADLRLTEIAYHMGLITEERWSIFSRKREQIHHEQQRLEALWVHPNTPASDMLSTQHQQTLQRDYNLTSLLQRPELSYLKLMQLPEMGPAVSDPQVQEQIEIQARYAGYIQRQHTEVERQKQQEHLRIPDTLNFIGLSGLSNEVQQKLHSQKPATIGQASRIPGITPAAISLLLVHIKAKQKKHCA
jgi:tRNA uridine 5-carboxymethylaminomethyl modification enzyme